MEQVESLIVKDLELVLDLVIDVVVVILGVTEEVILGVTDTLGLTTEVILGVDAVDKLGVPVGDTLIDAKLETETLEVL